MAVKPDEWTAVGGITLEPNAEAAARSVANSIVVAGPGAGKTELLAQRACYLLETGSCPDPRMILAISFKRDAAKNLGDRVQKRCGSALARRFHSFTYDAFTKGLVDRFRLGIPTDFRPSPDYEIIQDSREVEQLIGPLGTGFGDGSGLDTRSVVASLGKTRLPFEDIGDDDPRYQATRAVWIHLVKERRPSSIMFPMLSRLAEFLLRQNPLLVTAMRACFSHVFLDEFQDTTDIQYDLLRTAFMGSESVLTAVGDTKQRIMGWAGAKPWIFGHFSREFSADSLDLLCNHRSAPRLVQIQHIVAGHLSPGTPPSTWSEENAKKGDGVCKVVLFSNPIDEAEAVAEKIIDLVTNEGIPPRQIAVLARLRVETYGGHIIKELHKVGIPARIESELQDLLAEPAVDLVISMLLLALGERDPESWQRIVDLLCDVRGGIDRESPNTSALEMELQAFLQAIRRETQVCETACSVDEIAGLFDSVISFIGEEGFVALYPQYSQGNYLQTTKDRIAGHLQGYVEDSSSFRAALRSLLGDGTVPILTIHKSKGLEYDTVFFIGLEDGAFWNYGQQPEEESCVFFVAFSRAKQRAYFTFSEVRNSGRGGSMRVEPRKQIGTLYELLEKAGVEVVDRR